MTTAPLEEDDLLATRTVQHDPLPSQRGARRLNYELTFFNLEVDDEIINSNVRPFPGAPLRRSVIERPEVDSQGIADKAARS